jgi:hypothetical protein
MNSKLFALLSFAAILLATPIVTLAEGHDAAGHGTAPAGDEHKGDSHDGHDGHEGHDDEEMEEEAAD